MGMEFVAIGAAGGHSRGRLGCSAYFSTSASRFAVPRISRSRSFHSDQASTLTVPVFTPTTAPCTSASPEIVTFPAAEVSAASFACFLPS